MVGYCIIFPGFLAPWLSSTLALQHPGSLAPWLSSTLAFHMANWA